MLQKILCAVLFAAPVVGGWAGPAESEDIQAVQRTELRRLMARAAKADDYRKLATYFSYQELLFREKARRVLEDFVMDDGRYPMATKTVARPDAVARVYHGYRRKADANARLAAKYARLLKKAGGGSVRGPGTVISLESLGGGSQ